MASDTRPPPDAPPPARQPTDPQPPDRDDVDTCRICRGESTPEEPLFHPCKCSGSIKYVHQECLMEWLSHSQKKYCELCKTSFRFTKLYHPGMPNTIPTSVFARRAAVHIVKLFTTWCRVLLVACVWLLLLPWCMRVVWRSLFWVGDGAWTREDYIKFDGNESSIYDLDALHAQYKAAHAANMTPNIPIPSLLTPLSQTLNATAVQPTIWTFAKYFLIGLLYPFNPVLMPPSLPDWTASNVTTNYLGSRNPSLLSHVSFVSWLPSQVANGFMIDVLEGQIITLTVVVAFILIFLIREWVVQQQPVINMVALGDDAAAAAHPAPEHQEHDAEENAARANQAPEHQEHEAEGHAAPAVVQEPAQESGSNPVPRHVNREVDDASPVRLLRKTPAAPFAERLERELARGPVILERWREMGKAPDDLIVAAFNAREFDLSEDWHWIIRELPDDLIKRLAKEKRKRESEPMAPRGRASSERSRGFAGNSSNEHGPSSESHTPPGSPSRRPHMPARGRSFMATEIQRRIEEDQSWSFANVPETTEDDASKPIAAPVPESWEDETTEPLANDQEHGSDDSSESWQQVPDSVVENNDRRISKDQGKSKIVPEDSGSSPVAIPAYDEERATETDSASDDEDSEIGDASSNEDVGSDPYRHNANTDVEDAEDPEDSLVNTAPTPEPEEEQAQEQEQGQDAQLEREAETQIVDNIRPPRNFLDHVLDWMFDGVAPGVQAAEDNANDEHIVRDLAEEAPFVPFVANEPVEVPNIQDPEVAAAAAQAGIQVPVQAGIDANDQDAIDDAEDLEGIMELIGMQGPLSALFQNAMFSAVLISATLTCAVWLPYLWGKIVILFLGSPVALLIKLPLQIVANLTDLLVDGILFIAAGAVYVTLHTMFKVVEVASANQMGRPYGLVAEEAWAITASAASRLHKLVTTSPLLPPPSYFRLSIHSHEALRTLQNSTSHALNETSNMITALLEDAATTSSSEIVISSLRLIPEAVKLASTKLYGKGTSLVSWLLTTKSYKITFDLDLGHGSSAVPMEHWTATDRLIAVLAGYAFFALAGAVYLKRGRPLSSSQSGQRFERIVSEVLQQAGGVLKVILIISIEMIVFPLYCGLLLDMALLPLFKDGNLYTRWQFTRDSPWTSGFVHWFIGTCYMFHFALFVSMCRKIMRRGVLYFIRDPDDPQFHPVRDVLERSVTTQLRKIAFSALVYGALVIICLGGVVWCLDRLTTGVLPIHWVSHAPSLELPLDLLFYNFLAPVIIKLYKPGEGLHSISAWWFKTCARFLRLSNFLFGEKAKDEEGRKVNGEIVFEGKYVRAPASDQVRIPKGDPVFVEVDEKNVRLDGKREGGVHNSSLVTMVYIPPWFRLRIATFVLAIWLFAAVAGVSATIIPLIFGRYIFSLILPSDVEMNDIHCFSLGLYTLGSLAYTCYQGYKFLRGIDRSAANVLATLYSIAQTTSLLGVRVLNFVYVWGGLIFLIPFLFAVIIEFYGLIPLHAYAGPTEPHVVHLIQDWTLGFLYARLVARLTLQNRASRPARAFSAVIRDGYLHPNARIATRCFLLPAVSIFAVAIAVPSSVAVGANWTLFAGADEQTRKLVWRFAYPAVGCAAGCFWAAGQGVRVVRRWRAVVRDEVYLIGERLHNFGERRGRDGGAVAAA